MTIHPDLVARFARDWRALVPDPDATILVALSGGPDSTALLLLSHALGLPLQAATVDHGLRHGSAAEAAQCALLSERLGIPHATLTGPMPPRIGATANLSARARSLRYALLGAHAAAIGARWVVTAHHADDQAETLAMRLNRGAGLRGMRGIRALGDDLARPLLGWRRAELAAIVAAAGIVAVDDPSNRDDRFDRARLRKALAASDWLDPLAAARSATALGEAEAAIAWTVDRLVDERCRFGGGSVTLDASALPAELGRRLVERCLSHVDPMSRPRGREVGEVVARLSGGGGGTLGTVRYAAGSAGLWTFVPAPPRRSLGRSQRQ